MAKKPAIAVKGGKIEKNTSFVKAGQENRQVNPEAEPPGTTGKTGKGAPESHGKPQSAESANKPEMNGKDMEMPMATPKDASNPSKEQNRNEDASASGQDTAILGTKHIKPGGHGGHGCGCSCPACSSMT